MSSGKSSLDLLKQIKPNDLIKYLHLNKWIRSETVAGKLAVYNLNEHEILLPLDPYFSDYGARVYDVIEQLSSIHAQSISETTKQVLLYWADVLRLKIDDPGSETGTVDLNRGVNLIDGGRMALAAAARQSRKLEKYYSKLLVNDINEYLRTCRLGLEFGSFVALLVCPADQELIGEDPAAKSIDLGQPLSQFTREVTTQFMRSAQSVFTAIEQEKIEAITNPQLEENIISSNFCDALAKMAPATPSAALTITANWSKSLPLTKGIPASVIIPKDYFGAIEAIADALKPKKSSTTETFAGTVDSLNGEPGKEGKMEGKVSLRLLVAHKWRVVKAHLSPSDYARACDFHKTQELVKIEGSITVDGPRAHVTSYSKFHSGKNHT